MSDIDINIRTKTTDEGLKHVTEGLRLVREGLVATQGPGTQAAETLRSVDGAAAGALSTMKGFLAAQTIMSGVAGAYELAKSAAIGMNSTLEKSTLQFTTLMGSASQAQDHVQDLFEIAKKTPFETGPIIDASKALQTFGGDALNTKANIVKIGDAAAATGAPINELGFWVGRLYSNIQGGQPFGEAAMRLQELAVMSPQARAQMEAMQKAGRDASEVFAVFTSDLDKFGGAMERQAGTWEGATSTFADSANMLVADAFKPLFEGLRDSLVQINDWLSSDEVQGFANWFASGLGAAVGSAREALSEFDAWVKKEHIPAALGAIWKEAVNEVRGANQSLLADINKTIDALGSGGKVSEDTARNLIVGEVFHQVAQSVAAWQFLTQGINEARMAVERFALADKQFRAGQIGAGLNTALWWTGTNPTLPANPLATNDLAPVTNPYDADVEGAGVKLPSAVDEAKALKAAKEANDLYIRSLEDRRLAYDKMGEIAHKVLVDWQADERKFFAQQAANLTASIDALNEYFDLAVSGLEKEHAAQAKANKANVLANADTLAELKGANAQYEEDLVELHMDGQALLQRRLDVSYRQQVAALQLKLNSDNAAIRTEAERELAIITQLYRDETAVIKNSHADWMTSLGQIGDTIKTLGAEFGSDFATSIGGGISAGVRAGAELNQAFSEISKNGVKGMGQLVSAIGSVVSAMRTATQSTDAMQNTLSGAATGASIGSMFGPIGAGVGAGIGAYVGWLSTADADVVASIQATADANAQIKALQSQLLATYGTASNLQALVQQLGLTLGNTSWEGIWSVNGTEGLKVLQQSIVQLNKVLADNVALIESLKNLQPGEALSKSVIDQIRSGKLTDGARAALGDFMTLQQQTIGSSLADFLKQQETLSAAGLAPNRATATGMFYAGTADAANMLASGAGWTEVAKLLAPSLAQLSAQTGVSNSMADLLKQVNDPTVAALLQTNKDIGNTAVSLFQLGDLSKDTLTQLTTGLGDSYQKLKDQGVTAADASKLMQSDLQKIWEIESKTGLTVDAATQQLIDQELKNGHIGEAYKTASEKLNDSITRLIASLDRLADWRGVPSPPEPHGQGTPVPGGSPDSGGYTGHDGGWTDDGTAPGFADGTDGFRYFGAGTLAMLHGWEAVITPQDLSPLRGLQPVIVQAPDVYLDGRRVSMNQARHLPYAIRAMGGYRG